MIDKQEYLSELWEYEKKLINMLHDIDQKHVIKEGKKKAFSVDGFLENNTEKSAHKTTPNIILPGYGNRMQSSPMSASPTRDRFQGGSMSERLDYLESLTNKVSKKNTNKILTFDENSVELDEFINLVKRGTDLTQNNKIDVHTESQNQISDIEEQAYSLTQKILQLRKELGFGWLCDTVTVYEINLKMGGDGNFTNTDGVKESLPNIPLSKNCPHRQHSKILRCVACPAHYSDLQERFDNWQTFIKTKQEANKKRE